MPVHTVQIDEEGLNISIETGTVARQANGSVLVRSGDSVVLVTACAEREPRAGVDFLPLTVDYREYTYAAGKIPGGFLKREGRPSEKEILTSRLIDRPLRPLFPEGYTHDTQIIGMVLSADPDRDPDTLALVGASAALAVSDIPFHEVVGAVRVGKVNGQLVANPTYEQVREGTLNIVVAATEQGIVMVEAGADEVPEEEVIEAIEFGFRCCQPIIAAIRELVQKAGKPKWTVEPPVFNEELYKRLEQDYRAQLEEALDTRKYSKLESQVRVQAIKKALLETVAEEERQLYERHFEKLRERIFLDWVLKERRRPDGRRFDEIRPIDIKVGLLPRTHGSALFTRGETQAVVTLTLGTKEEAQRLELLEPGEVFKRFMLHYNFPPFSVGETGPLRGPGRREIGHGALAERALLAVIPDEQDFPYTIRIVSDILESNGSSSMATVCGASLALMDAGVPVTTHVAGIAMGLVKEGDDYVVLTDIAGAEDHYGDMDFKVAGTASGITALQMDIKIPNISTAIMREALEQARKARMEILEKMQSVIAEPRPALSPYAPRVFTMTVPQEKIRDLIGPGGKMIRSIIDQTGVKIDVSQDGTVLVYSPDEEAARVAQQMIADVTAVPEVGKNYLGRVTRIVDFGAFVEIFPGTEGLLHISEIAEHRVRNVRDELRVGDQVMVKVIGVEGNKIRLSRRAVLREQRLKHRRVAHPSS